MRPNRSAGSSSLEFRIGVRVAPPTASAFSGSRKRRDGCQRGHPGGRGHPLDVLPEPWESYVHLAHEFYGGRLVGVDPSVVVAFQHEPCTVTSDDSM